MHANYQSLSFLRSLSSEPKIKSFRGKEEEVSSPVNRIRSFLRSPKTGERFSAGGFVEAALAGDATEFRKLMRKLAARIAREQWKTAIGENLAPNDNPHIPAGYTYLLQLIAHDMVHSSVSLAGSATGTVGLTNTRLAPLTLETIYGGGPDVCPHAYEIDEHHRSQRAVIPRTRFRVGQSRNMNGSMTECAFHDIARAIPANVNDRGLESYERLDLSEACTNPWRTEALLADPRNDDHAIISQIAGLWQRLHNYILDLIPADLPDTSVPQPEQAYRRFFCGRVVTTLIYRNIIREDVLRLILHPEIHKLYSSPTAPQLDASSENADSMPVEFLAGAFRFGHAMVRNEYQINSDTPRRTTFALKQSSLRSPGDLPLNENWVLDWSRFFTLGDRQPNFTQRIGPVFAGVLLDSAQFPKLTDFDHDGLQDRDLVTAGFSGMWSVPALSAEIRARGLTEQLPDFSAWQDELRAWLSEPSPFPGLDPYPLTPAEIEVLVADPPLPFFVLFEAGQAVSETDAPPDKAAGESLHLGALGSIIVAETIYGALARTPISFENTADSLQERIAAVCGELLGDTSALSTIPELATMADLLHFMIKGGAIPESKP